MEINVLIEKGLEGCLDQNWLRLIAERVLVAAGADLNAELSLVIATQQKIQELNKDYLGRDEPTDVLAFPMLSGGKALHPFVPPPDGVNHLGEVIISYPQAVIQAEEYHHSTKKEVTILIIHGVLHLLGYEDEKPELKCLMSAREKEILSYVERELDLD